MEFSTKKKKRRTRKCLDEIRKRSRRMMHTGCFGKVSRQHETNKTEGHTYTLITMNRLTLNMFPKAIRSETITRPLLEEIKQKSSFNFGGFNKNKVMTSNIEPEVECFEHCNSTASNNSMPMFDLEEQSQNPQHGRSPIGIPLRDYLNLHSLTPVTMSVTPADLIAKIYSNSTTSSMSTQTLDGNHGLELYEELMHKISSHLKKVTSAIIKEDVIKNTKINLQKLYNRSWGKEYPTSMLEHEKSRKSTETFESPKDFILQNPLDYIRLKHDQQQGVRDDFCHSGFSETFSSQSPAAAVTASHSPLTLGRDCTQDTTLYGTPEYNYYPHRLN